MNKITEIWVYNGIDRVVVFRGQNHRRSYSVAQHRLSRLATIFVMMKIRGEIDIWPSGLGYYIQVEE